MAALRTRRVAVLLMIGSGVLAARPMGFVRPVADVLALPARFAAPLGSAARAVALARGPSTRGASDDVLPGETAASLQLERSVLLSAWPQSRLLQRRFELGNIDPIPGEVEARGGRSRDIIRVRVADPTRVAVDQPVVAGDVFIGRVARVPFRERVTDRPGVFERAMRALRLSSAPAPPPRDAVDVALITGASERIGGHIAEDQNGNACDLVVGGLAAIDDRVWLAVHAPESRRTQSGRVVVKEPLALLDGDGSLCEGFAIGDLRSESVTEEGMPYAREVLGVQPLVDFSTGLNQVLVLAPNEDASMPGAGPNASSAAFASVEPIPVMSDGGWTSGRALVHGDTSPWRATLRLDCGRGRRVREGAAVVDGVRFVGRVTRADLTTSAVATLGDPGFRVSALAQDAKDPSAAPMSLGVLESLGRTSRGSVLLRWTRDPSLRVPDWFARGRADVVLWTGSGMSRVPRGLRLGRAALPPVRSDEAAAVILELWELGSPLGALRIRTGNERLASPIAGGTG